jgi:hypothetical protein
VKSGAAVTTTVVADTTKPTLVSALYTTPVASTAAADQASLMVIGTGAGAGGATATNGVASAKGDVKISVLGSGAYAGKAGNLVKLHVDLNAGITGATCAFSAASKTISVVVEAITIDSPVVATACNNAATFQGSFVAVAQTDTANNYDLGEVADSTVAAGYALAGGKNKFNVTLTFSEPIAAYTVANSVVTSNCASSCVDETAAVVVTAATEAAQELAGVITLTVSSTTVPAAGLDKVTVAAAILDRNANALSVASTTHIVFMQLGS